MLSEINFVNQVYAALRGERNGIAIWNSRATTNIFDEVLDYYYLNIAETLITCLSPYGVCLDGFCCLGSKYS